MKARIPLLLIVVFNLAQAETPSQIAGNYAAAQGSGYSASAARGAAFYARNFGISDKMPSCTACHTDQPMQTGRHAVTGKAIKPLATAANSERFTDPAKVEKWFRRNCTEVVGRECTAAEKADFVQFALEGR